MRITPKSLTTSRILAKKRVYLSLLHNPSPKTTKAQIYRKSIFTISLYALVDIDTFNFSSPLVCILVFFKTPYMQ